MPRYLQLAIAALSLTIVACAHHHRAAAEPAAIVPPLDPVNVNVTNNSQSSMEIYVIGNGTSYHIGSVAPGLPRMFELRAAVIVAGGHVQFLAQASGAGPRITTDEVLVRPGDIVDFEITTSLVGSRATVRPR